MTQVKQYHKGFTLIEIVVALGGIRTCGRDGIKWIECYPQMASRSRSKIRSDKIDSINA